MRLVIENGKIEFGGNTLIEHLNFSVNNNDKIALIGKNGCGKTSLLKVIQGELDLTFDSGNLDGYINKSNDFTLGYLKQISFSNENITLEEAMLECYKEVIDLENKLRELEKKLEVDVSDNLIKEYSRIQELYENKDGYYYKKEYCTVLNKFGFKQDSFNKPLNAFSGGEKTKIAFIKLLLTKPDLLLLDEPTNHLDIEAIEWLETYLKNYKKAFIVVSHDREFINQVASTVYEIEFNTLNKYSGNYDNYLVEKETRYKTMVKEYNEKIKERDHLQETVDRFRYKATKAKMAQDRIKKLDKLEIIEPLKMSDTKTFKVNINPESESGKEVLTIKDLKIGYDKELSMINLNIFKGNKIGIIGENGTGKSTFLKTIMGIIKPLGGEYKYGFNVKKGYFDQQSATLVKDETILDNYINEYPLLTNKEARSDLGAFLFSGEDVMKKMTVLSGGEVVRLALCKLLKKRYNFLLLDEPTNHMDIISKETIEKMLKEYKGTLLFVSHDRYFVRKIATSLLVFENNNVTYYPCSYNEYLSTKNKQDIIVSKEEKVKEKETIKVEKNVSKKEIKKLEKDIEIHEQRIKEINDLFEKEEIYTDFMQMRELEEELENLDDELRILMREWEEMVENIE